MTNPRKRAEEFVSFMRQVAIGAEKGSCWLWTGGGGDGRYGHFSINGGSIRCHRWIYEFVCEPIPDGQVIRHRCDNPKCVNPAHLEVGTYAQNTADAVQRGRWANRQGVKHPLAVLGEVEVKEIRRLASCGMTQKQIATRYEISSQHVGKIVRRESWGHI